MTDERAAVRLDDRFWSKVRFTETCWLWTGSLWHGYGRFMLEGRPQLAHRVAYEKVVGPRTCAEPTASAWAATTDRRPTAHMVIRTTRRTPIETVKGGSAAPAERSDRRSDDMPAEIETLMYAREVPWHGFGTKVEGLQTAEDAIVHAGLDWEVKPKPIYTHNHKGQMVKVPERLANVRLSDGKPLGVVSPTYKVLQNRDAFRIADEIVKTGAAKYETAGSLRGGKVVFISMELPKTVTVPGDDGIMVPYLLAANSHDGSMAIRFLITLIRVVCANTLSAALGSHKAEIRLRHTTNVDQRVGEAQKALGLTFAYLDEFEKIAEKMLLTKVNEKEILRTLAQVFPMKDVNPLKLSGAELRRIISSDVHSGTPVAKALRMYETSDNIDNIRGTAYGVYNAVAEYIDYGMAYRSREVTAADNRASSILLAGPAASKKQKAADLLIALS